ncbi:MAG: type II secretion system protein GspG [Pirellulaceae bacterium]
MYKLISILLAVVFALLVAIVIIVVVNRKEPEIVPEERAAHDFAQAITPDVDILDLEQPYDNESLAKAQLGAFRQQIDAFQLDVGSYPTTQQGLAALRVAPPEFTDEVKWEGPYAPNSIPPDPWGNPYLYELLSPSEYRVFSAGPDGKPNTADDVVGSDE